MKIEMKKIMGKRIGRGSVRGEEMLGYVTADRPELKVREYELYGGYYCGVCKSIGRRFGQLPRLVLSYDAAFLALLLSSFTQGRERVFAEHCVVHPVKKKSVVYQEDGVDYAGDMMLILAYYKLKDDWRDDRNPLAGAGMVLSKKIFKKLVKKYPDKCIMIKKHLEDQIRLEKEGCASLDQAAEPFAKLMELVALPEDHGLTCEEAEELKRFGYHLGKWIYLVDAYDDLEADRKKGAYNPLLRQFECPEDTSVEAFQDRIKERIEFNLLSCLGGLAQAYEKLPVKRNQGILENIIYLGLFHKTEQILGKTEKAENEEKKENAESI